MFSIIQRLRDRRDSEEGFTLIELMVVVMIIAILMAIAIPAFLGARKRAQDSSAKSALRNTVSEAQVVYSDTQEYPQTAALITLLTAEEPNFTFGTAASTGPKVISVDSNATATLGSGTTVIFGARSAAGNCFYLRHVSSGGATGGIAQHTATGATCPTSAAVAGDATATWTQL